MGKTISVLLDDVGLRKLQKRIDDYCFTMKSYATKEFCQRLADVGIRMANRNLGEYDGYVLFKKQIVQSNGVVKLTIIAYDKKKIVSKWKARDGIREEEISPILMAEFGSGWMARSRWGDLIPGVGQGTLNKYGHAFDPDGWHWVDLEGKKHHSYGQSPTYPMYAAYMEMQSQIVQIGKDVFKQC